VAGNLVEFADALNRVSIHCIITTLSKPDCGEVEFQRLLVWLDQELDLGPIADRINRIDIYTSTLQDVRAQLFATWNRVLDKAAN